MKIAERGDGVLVAFGGLSAGFALYVKDGKPVYHYNWFDRTRTSITSPTEIPDGECTVSFEFLYGGGAGRGGEGILFVDGREVARERIEATVAARFGIDTFGVGTDTGSPVTTDYPAPFPFTGRIERVDIHLGEPGLDPDHEAVLNAKFRAGKEY